MQIHQLLAGASAGDAITKIAQTTRTVLRRYGHSEIYAHHIDPTADRAVHPLATLPRGTSEDVLILRASIGDVELFDALADRDERIMVAYHNITPPRFFSDVDPAFADLLALGRDQLRDLRPRVHAAYADSTFNATDLADLGYDDVAVIPPLLDPGHLRDQPADPAFALEIQRRCPDGIVLFVGQLLPHKQPEALIAAHHLLTAHHRPDAALVLVGAHRSPDYARALQAFAASLNLPRVWFTGSLTDSRLAELYRRADVFVTASSHEGFCVPLTEAMALSVPLVATAAGAIPETAGGAALLLPDDAPETIAEALALVLQSPMRGQMVLAGRRRAEELGLPAAEERLTAFLDRHLLSV